MSTAELAAQIFAVLLVLTAIGAMSVSIARIDRRFNIRTLLMITMAIAVIAALTAWLFRT